jgi:hypothetical protein
MLVGAHLHLEGAILYAVLENLYPGDVGLTQEQVERSAALSALNCRSASGPSLTARLGHPK